MATRPRVRFWRSAGRRLGAAAALSAYLAAALGLPLPAAPVRKDASHPFPCQDHACGCQSAEECWSGCCCFSPEERWAWAEAHHVEPPAYAERPAAPAPVATGWSSAPLRARAAGASAAPRCCAEKQTRPKPGCSGETACAGCCDAGHAAPAPAAGVRWLPSIAALHCRGLATLWVAGAALPPPPALAWVPWLPAVGDAVPQTCRPVCVARTPPAPPPRSPLV